MCDNQKCLKQQCNQYDTCWFLKVKCFNCNSKVDVRESKKTVINLPDNKESKIEIICCPLCLKVIW